MAVRTTHDEVLEIMDNCTVSHSVIDKLIIAASAVVDQVFLDDDDIGDTLLAEIEKWLTAHMIASTSLYRTTSEEEVGDARAKYTGQWGKKLESTPYGQMVLTLDTTGKMARLGKMAASIFAVPSFDD